MSVYKTVYDLDDDELTELKYAYFDQLQNADDDNEFMFPEEIPDVIVQNHYEGIYFTDDDFFCNITDDSDLEGCGAAHTGI